MTTNPNSTEQELRELREYQQLQDVYLKWHEGHRPLSGFIHDIQALVAQSNQQAVQRFAERLLKQLPQDLETKESDSAEIIRYIHGHNAGLYQARQRIEAALREANHA